MISICKYCGGTAPDGTDICRNCSALLKIADSTVSASDITDGTEKLMPHEAMTDSIAGSADEAAHAPEKSNAELSAAEIYNTTDGLFFGSEDISAQTDTDAGEIASLATLITSDAEDADMPTPDRLDNSLNREEELSVLAELSETAHASESEDGNDTVSDEPIVIVPPIINELFTLSYDSEPITENTPVEDKAHSASYGISNTNSSGATESRTDVKRDDSVKTVHTTVNEKENTDRTSKIDDITAPLFNDVAEIKTEKFPTSDNTPQLLNKAETDDKKSPANSSAGFEETQAEELITESPTPESAEIDTVTQINDIIPTVSGTDEKKNDPSPEWTAPEAEIITEEWTALNTDPTAPAIWTAPLADIIKVRWNMPKADIIPAERLEAAGLTAKEIAVEPEEAQNNSESKPRKRFSKIVSESLESFRDALKKGASFIARSVITLKKAVCAAIILFSRTAKKTVIIVCKICGAIKHAVLATGHFLIGKQHERSVFNEHIGLRETAICCIAYLPFMFPAPTILMPKSKFMRYHSICGAAITITVVVIQLISLIICKILESVFTVTVNAGTSFEHTTLHHRGFTLIAFTETALLVLLSAIIIHALSMAVFHRKNVLVPNLFYRIAERGTQNATARKTEKNDEHISKIEEAKITSCSEQTAKQDPKVLFSDAETESDADAISPVTDDAGTIADEETVEPIQIF